MAEEKKSTFAQMKPAELEKIVVELAKSGETPAKIGLILRDKHGVPKAKLIGKRITQILKEAKVPVVSDETKVRAKITKLEGHIGKNKHDYSAKRSLTKKLWLVARK
jgi:small subunit ribosomal protein S15